MGEGDIGVGEVTIVLVGVGDGGRGEAGVGVVDGAVGDELGAKRQAGRVRQAKRSLLRER